MKHRLSTFIAVFTITVATLIFGSFQNDVKAVSYTHLTLPTSDLV